MAFKSIGTLAGEVLKKAKAARANQVALEFEAVPLSRWEAEEAEPPNAQTAGGDAGANGNGKKGRAMKPGPSVHREVRQTWEMPGGSGTQHASLPTMDRSKVIASPTSRSPRRSAIIFDLGMERARRHASPRTAKATSSAQPATASARSRKV